MLGGFLLVHVPKKPIYVSVEGHVVGSGFLGGNFSFGGRFKKILTRCRDVVLLIQEKRIAAECDAGLESRLLGVNMVCSENLQFAPVLGFNAWLGVFIESGCQGEHKRKKIFYCINIFGWVDRMK